MKNSNLLGPVLFLMIVLLLSGCDSGAVSIGPDLPTATVEIAANDPLPTATQLPEPTEIPVSPVIEDVDDNNAPLDNPDVDQPTVEKPYPADCVDALSVTLDDVGREMCVAGTVKAARQSRGVYTVSFESREGAFFMVGYDWGTNYGVNPGDCVYATGKIEQIGVSPVMKITQFTLKKCIGAEPAPPRPPQLPTDCLFALNITMGEVGQEVCLGGIVHYAGGNSKEYRIYFDANRELGASLIIYGMKDGERGANPGDCIFVRNRKIAALGSRLLVVIVAPDIQRCSE